MRAVLQRPLALRQVVPTVRRSLLTTSTPSLRRSAGSRPKWEDDEYYEYEEYEEYEDYGGVEELIEPAQPAQGPSSTSATAHLPHDLRRGEHIGQVRLPGALEESISQHILPRLRAVMRAAKYEPTEPAPTVDHLVALRLDRSYAACFRVLHELRCRRPGFVPTSVLEFGAGVGPGCWAAHALWCDGGATREDMEDAAESNSSTETPPAEAAADASGGEPSHFVAVEPNARLRATGEELSHAHGPADGPSIRWTADMRLPGAEPALRVASGEEPSSGGKGGDGGGVDAHETAAFDLVMAPYALSALSEAGQAAALRMLLQRVAAGGTLALVEQSSPSGLAAIALAKDELCAAAPASHRPPRPARPARSPRPPHHQSWGLPLRPPALQPAHLPVYLPPSQAPSAPPLNLLAPSPMPTPCSSPRRSSRLAGFRVVAPFPPAPVAQAPPLGVRGSEHSLRQLRRAERKAGLRRRAETCELTQAVLESTARQLLLREARRGRERRVVTEGFSYLLCARDPTPPAPPAEAASAEAASVDGMWGRAPFGRVLSTPRKKTKHVLLDVLTPENQLQSFTVTKRKTNRDDYRFLRKAQLGSTIPMAVLRAA